MILKSVYSLSGLASKDHLSTVIQSKKTWHGTTASSFRGAHSRLTRTITQQKIRALVSTHRDRDKQKRNFHRLWIARINAVIRDGGDSNH
ncbi:50S ribosomal protein l20 chloroplastic [Phtheirospermum japonicum]|uniref:Large ribosomal subunit protein bL20c n=1 Tax=Phtheirospermum japonicum TaxID=374723 RepID=A0A830BL32_9LAMI|nr:50S ribosomal protein l20 chloroplastic [Phtheirospermum japonicum]